MTMVNKTVGQEMVDRLIKHLVEWEKGTLELTADVLDEIDFLIEAEEIYYEDLVDFYLGSYCSEVDADYYAIITMEDAHDMQEDLMSKYISVE